MSFCAEGELIDLNSKFSFGGGGGSSGVGGGGGSYSPTRSYPAEQTQTGAV